MKKLKLFLENFIIYGFGSIISKIIPLIMVPIVTQIMPNTAYYGISDMSNTIVSFATAFAVMGMYDAMYRMFFERDDIEYKKDICSTALLFTLFTSLVVFLIMIVMKDYIAEKFLGDSGYAYVVYITAIATLLGATNSIIAAPTRMENKRGIFLLMNGISPILSYSIAIPLLLNGYYIIALPLAAAVSALFIECTFGFLNRRWFFKKCNFQYLKQMLVIAIPLFPNFLIYWVFNSCDKLMITNIIGMSATGIYSVGSKLGHASQLIYTAFAGGWQYFAFSTMNDSDQVKSNSMVYEYLGIISFIASIFICAWSYPIFRCLFEGDYIRGYIVAPYLFLAPLLQMLFQVACNQFIVIKKTWPNMLILSSGAILNIVLNLWLIPQIGIEGAAIATLMGYVAANILCVAVLRHMRLMQISGRFMAAIAVLVAYMLIWRLFLVSDTIWSSMLALGVMILYAFLYKKDLLYLFKMIKEEK